MNPFELTKNPDDGGITVRVKHDFVVLTSEEEKRITEHITEILAENDKLRELVIRMRSTCIQGKRCTFADKLYISKAMEELGIEVKDA
ncbi:MAG: hypothetical protein IJ943_03635 [Akkermansia sp.]|nr:hypothetical protein [Akkermansia sp.]MBR2683081.1 hypothetical protein [Atopobiaceae bacterium]MBR3387512.1 hypothetical protein [Bacteroidales bacterium]